MNAATSAQMMQIVARIREQAEAARDNFDHDAAIVGIYSAESIHLNSGTAVNRVTDIASRARLACDKLYAALQTAIRIADEECRPLLNAQPDLASVRAVHELIRWLNEESEIKVNFAASINERDCGNILSGQYIPTMEGRMLESYWQTKYDTWADWVCAATTTVDTAAPAPIKLSPAAEALSRTLQEANQRTDLAPTAEELAYLDAYRRWTEEKATLKDRQEAEIERRVAAVQAEWEARFRASYDRTVARSKETMERELQRIREAQATMKSLPIFRMKQQIAQQEIINQADAKYRAASEALKEAEETLAADMKLAAKHGEDERFFIRKKVLQDMPEPEAPAIPHSLTVLQSSNLVTQKAIAAGMAPGRQYTLDELCWEIPVAASLSAARLSAMLRQMIPEQLERTEKNGKACFRRVQ